MRLARRALFAALTTLILLSAVTAQTLRPGNDPRNQAPTVGTGGPPGGPTGLFTIYDGDTLRKGEFTFSIAYSNYDRDPGDAATPPVNVGLNDQIELCLKTNGINVNNPRNLSSFYLPNSQLFSGQLTLGKVQIPTRLEHFSCSNSFAQLQYCWQTCGSEGISDHAAVISQSALSPRLRLLLSG